MKFWIVILISAALFACQNEAGKTVYNGRMDADVVRVSAQTGGTIDSLFAEEGQLVHKNDLLLTMDSKKTKLRLQQQTIQQEEAQINLQTIHSQIKQIQAQLDLMRSTRDKTRAMVASGAATQQKLDELETQVQIFTQKINSLHTQQKLIRNKQAQLEAAIRLTRLSIDDTRVTAPLTGQVLNRFVNVGEFAAPGMPLFEIADLTRLEATIYMPLESLGQIKPGQTVQVHADGQKQTFKGTVKWVSEESEFTPKTILTKETRTTLVYRVKINVPNPDGILKIGMPVDVEL